MSRETETRLVDFGPEYWVAVAFALQDQPPFERIQDSLTDPEEIEKGWPR